MTLTQAHEIASRFYDVKELQPSYDTGPAWGIRTLSGWVALVGLIDGIPAILHKKPDGTRELETLDLHPSKAEALKRTRDAGFNAFVAVDGIMVTGEGWSAFYSDRGQAHNAYTGKVPPKVDELCVWDDPTARDTGGTTKRKKHGLCFAFDISHYADFSIESDTPEEALRIAQGLLDTDDLEAMFRHRAAPCESGMGNTRVFLLTGSGDHLDTLEEIAEAEDYNLPDDWRESRPMPDRTHQEFEALCNNIAAAPDLEGESDTYRKLAEMLWGKLTPEQRSAFIVHPDTREMIDRAETWGRQD